MGIRKYGLRVYVDVPSLKTASLATIGLSEQEQREAKYIAAVDGSGLGVVLKDPTGPTGIIMPILEQPARGTVAFSKGNPSWPRHGEHPPESAQGLASSIVSKQVGGEED